MNVYRELTQHYSLDAQQWRGEPADIIVLQYGFGGIDEALSKAPVVVTDINDMLFQKGHPAADDFERNIGRVHAVVAGSPRLEQHLRLRHPVVRYITEGIDDKFFGIEPQHHEGTNIVWMGMHDNLMFFSEIDDTLAKLATKYDFTMHVLCPELDGQGNKNAEKVAAKPYPTKFTPWSPLALEMAIAEADIAVTPLFQNEWCYCKSSNKAISFMAAGLPVVASAVPSYEEVITSGATGYLALHPEHWDDALSALLEKPELRRRVGANGRESVRKFRSYEVAGLWADFLRSIAPA